MSCRQVATLLDTFVDGELPPDQALSVEEHLAECTSCTERLEFEGAVRSSLKSAVHSAAEPSAGFEAHLASALRAERERLLEVDEQKKPRGFGKVVWLPALAVAASALGGVALVQAQRRHEDQQVPVEIAAVPTSQAAAAAETPEHALNELVAYHAAPPEPQITEPRLVERLAPEVGVPVRYPAGLKQYGASWEGAGTVPMNHQRAALFRYRLSNHPVTVYVYDATRVPLRAVLEPRVVHNQSVHVGERHGYSIAAVEQRGVGYAIATDLNDDESAELVTTMY